MHIKTMEGLTGASTNHHLLKTPIRVYKEARRRGDMSTMERAMKYASDFSGKTQEYQAKAEEGMKEDAKEAKEREKLEQEKAIEKRKAKQENLEENTALEGTLKADTLEISEEGKAFAENPKTQENPEFSGNKSYAPKAPPLLYAKTGAAELAGNIMEKISITI